MGEVKILKVVESITIRYFRSVYTLTISPCNDITVITGKNDVGKSNILKALNLFFCQQTDHLSNFNFTEDYSMLRKEEVKKDTIRGQQFISITVRFLRGERMQNSLPPSFSVTRRWDMHSPDYKETTDVHVRMQQYAKKNNIRYSEKTTAMFYSMFLNRIKFIYVPAIKDTRVFNDMVNWLQQSLFDAKNKKILDAPITKANEAVQKIVGGLQFDFKAATGIDNFVELPNTLNYAKGLLQINTATEGGMVSIDKRGDGIRTHYIPKILNYVAENSKDIYIWGFEEPENSYEYRRCIQVAEEFENRYCKSSQIFISTHSPAFYNNPSERKSVVNVGYEQNKTVLLKDVQNLNEELGYIELYQDFIERVKQLEKENALKDKNITALKQSMQQSQTPLVLTEGKTDAALLKLAIKKLNLSGYENWEIKPILSDKTVNNDVLIKFLNEICDNMSSPRLVIGMFDRDTKIEVSIDSEVCDVRNEEFVKLAKNIYAFAIPVPHNRVEVDQISIEHYFTDAEIKTEKNGKRLYLGNEFYCTGVYKGDEEWFYKAAANVADTIKVIEHESKKYVTKQNGDGDYSLSKAAFVQCIENNDESFREISFNEFNKIFAVIAKIVTHCNGDAQEECLE